jgi:cell division protein FtsW
MNMKQNTITVMTLCLVLTAIGIMMVYSTGVFFPGDRYVVYKQAVYATLGLAAFFFLARFDYRHFMDPVIFRAIVLGSLGLLVLVLAVGHEVDGGKRWLRLGPAGFQPSEVAKFGLVLLLAVKLTQGREHVRKFWRGFLPPMIIVSVFAGLVAAERDIGIPFMMFITAFAMVFAAGANLAHMAACSLPVVAAGGVAIYFAPHRLERLSAFLNPFADRRDTGWQLIQSLSAFAQGGVFGRGAGASEQKLGYLPAAHTDFIFPVIGEEFGLWGSCLVVALFLGLISAMLRIAMGARDLFGSLLVTGIASLIGFQAAFIIAVTTGLLPTKGLPLPFISFGGTALLMSLAMSGVVVNVGLQSIGVAPQRRITAPSGPAKATAGVPARI